VSQEGAGQAGGSVRMINVADKPVVRRTARATATVRMAPKAAAMAAAGELPKGDMGAVAAVAALNVYDLVKGTDPAVHIEDVRLLEKTKEDPRA